MIADGRTAPDLAGFRTHAETQRVIPVYRTVLADGLTPVAVYQALTGGRPGTFLLESAEHGQWARYSFVGVASAAMLTADDGEARWIGRVPAGLPTQGRAVDVLRDTVAALATPAHPDLPPFTSGMVGYLSYDVVRRWERLPDANPDELTIPELGMLLATDIAVVDHTDGTVTLIANAINFDDSPARVDEAWTDAVSRLDEMTRALAEAPSVTVAALSGDATVEVAERTPRDTYLAGVETAREHIRAGDAFQIVLSQRFSAPCPADATDVYRVLRATNPSPYMFLIRLPDTAPGADLTTSGGWDVVGSSPEALVTVKDGQATMHPIAGTRPRGGDPETDARLADDLLADDKERAEHLMLVDLGRNDLGRVCAPGSVEVVEFMAVERYSHVMHLVSTVVGRLSDGRTAFDALAATFPAGTLSGAPKPRAMEIIDDLEPVRRGLYGGAVGYLDFSGGSDTAIAIRTALIRDNVAYVQAGAGLVADSDPVREDQECRDKAAAVLRAVAVAATMAPVDGPPSETERAK